MAKFVAGWGVATVVAAVAGLGTIGGLLALIQLGGLIGAPLALVLNRELRSGSVVVVMSLALSLALSALAVQSLIWFGIASSPLVVVVGTTYGIVLALLLAETERPEAVR